MKKNVLITGGTGTVGRRLTQLLQESGYEVSYLSRHASSSGNIKTYLWDIDKNYIDPNAIIDNDIIVHLAGAGVFDKAWTAEYKKEILDSRIRSTQLISQAIKLSNKKPECMVCASAIGIYGSETTSEWRSEQDFAATGFLADVVIAWEAAVEEVADFSVRTVKVRIGIVLSKTGGALEQLAAPVRLMAGAPLGNGEQWTPWIHIDDLCRIFIHAINNESVRGVYNAASPQPLTNAALTKAIARILHKPLWLPAIPAFVMNIILGKEKASFVLGGSRVSPNKILATGFQFKFESVEDALKDLLLPPNFKKV